MLIVSWIDYALAPSVQKNVYSGYHIVFFCSTNILLLENHFILLFFREITFLSLLLLCECLINDLKKYLMTTGNRRTIISTNFPLGTTWLRLFRHPHRCCRSKNCPTRCNDIGLSSWRKTVSSGERCTTEFMDLSSQQPTILVRNSPNIPDSVCTVYTGVKLSHRFESISLRRYRCIPNVNIAICAPCTTHKSHHFDIPQSSKGQRRCTNHSKRISTKRSNRNKFFAAFSPLCST